MRRAARQQTRQALNKSLKLAQGDAVAWYAVATRLRARGYDVFAAMSGRGVKYWPAPPFTSSAFLCSKPS